MTKRSKKLDLRKETLVDLQVVYGGGPEHNQKTYENTVYYGPGISTNCTATRPIQA